MPRVALVTGSSRGLGAAIAARLAQDGLAVAVNARRGAERAVADAIGGEAFTADVTSERDVTQLVSVFHQNDAFGREIATVVSDGTKTERKFSVWDELLEEITA